MKNEILNIKKNLKDFVVKEYQSRNYYVAKLDGSKIYTLVDYMDAIVMAFNFPDGVFINKNSIDSYNDWMRDLSWIEQYDGYVLIIEHIDNMMLSYPEDKAVILDEFRETILPFWEKEILHVVAGGKVKEFKIYLIE